ncbi:hypothetical protein HPB50_003504 [Hyalomma asiaticum]|uniref:Uncharacterized protein n=1 Tax=Hyalomma asiaticum TaxID=266040 RepID=A0ACB7SK97_HYAAI|nr:hypothetical protein HPB50_003504 [Hyalomma asiaticum]
MKHNRKLKKRIALITKQAEKYADKLGRNVSNTTCPLCREEFESTKETWVISEAPESSEVLSEMQKALSHLPEQKGNSS